MYVCMLVSIADDKAYKEKFSEDDVEASFLYLLNKLEALCNNNICTYIIILCIASHCGVHTDA